MLIREIDDKNGNDLINNKQGRGKYEYYIRFLSYWFYANYFDVICKK